MDFNFKNSGRSVLDVFDETKEKLEEKKKIPYGIKTPLRHGSDRAGIFEMNFNIGDQIADNLRNLVQTNHGERLGHFDFGANLEQCSLVICQMRLIAPVKLVISKFQMRMRGLEPPRQRQQYLKLPRLPIPPHPQSFKDT